jgi:hypothetical protein
MSEPAAPPEAGQTRYDATGPIRCMAVAGGYLMVRRPRAAPFVVSAREWLLLAAAPVLPGATGPRATIYGVTP